MHRLSLPLIMVILDATSCSHARSFERNFTSDVRAMREAELATIAQAK